MFPMLRTALGGKAPMNASDRRKTPAGEPSRAAARSGDVEAERSAPSLCSTASAFSHLVETAAAVFDATGNLNIEHIWSRSGLTAAVLDGQLAKEESLRVALARRWLEERSLWTLDRYRKILCSDDWATTLRKQLCREAERDVHVRRARFVAVTAKSSRTVQHVISVSRRRLLAHLAELIGQYSELSPDDARATAHAVLYVEDFAVESAGAGGAFADPALLPETARMLEAYLSLRFGRNRQYCARDLAWRRPGLGADGVPAVSVGPYRIDLQTYQLFFDGDPVDLSSREFDLCALLFGSIGAVLSKTLIADRVGYHDGGRSIDAAVSRIRKKLMLDSTSVVRIRSVHGRGYRMEYCAHLAAGEAGDELN